ncbi:MAG: hypothetical protein ABFS56_29620 [Pseudomonadota bacterium]
MSPLTQAATDCATVTQIPSTECEALVALYNSTDGDNWQNNRKWLETNKPCGWTGVAWRVMVDMYLRYFCGATHSPAQSQVN